ncbi:MAG: lipase family protein [Parashewanella sp.]
MSKVLPYQTGLQAGTAYWMARLSLAAYSPHSQIDVDDNSTSTLDQLRAEDANFQEIYRFDNNSSQAILVEHKEYYCMAFRGTDETKDWLANVNIRHHSALFGEFHSGFWHALADIWSPLFEKYMDLKRRNPKPLFITGHSLGGALATIAAAKLIEIDSPFTSVYTFGQPRVLTRSTARIFNAECKHRFFRFHNNNDIVPRFPTRLSGYSHIGTYLYISEEQQIHQEIGYWHRFIDNLDGLVSSIVTSGIDAIDDHDMQSYLTALSQWHYIASN